MFSKTARRLVVLGITLAAAGSSPAVAAGPASAPSDLESRWGVRVLGIRLASSGYMLDFRYTVTDAVKAAPLFTRGLKPVLEDETTGVRTVVPSPPKTGPLRSTNRPIEGRTYFMFFANPARHVRPGRTVSVAIGDFKAARLKVLAEDQAFPEMPRVRALPPAPDPAPGSTEPLSDHCAQIAAAEAKAAASDGGPSVNAQDPHAAHRAAAAAAAGSSSSTSPTTSSRDPASAGSTKSKARPVALAVPGVTLTDQDGRKVALGDLLTADEPVLVNFLFTTCTTICPVMAATFSQVQKDLGREPVRMVSVSIDPEQDTPRRMREFLGRHGAGPQWSFLTGTVEQSEAVQRAFDVYRGNKMSHPPVYFLKASDGSWLRFDGLVSAATLTAEVRRAASE